MIARRLHTIIVAMLLCLAGAVAQTSFHYFSGFETSQDTAGWKMKKRAAVKSEFVIGRAAHRLGSRSLYVSADGGATAGYVSTASGYVSVAYRKFTFAAGTYRLAFDLRMGGDLNANNDVLSVAYFPTTKADGTAQTPAAASLGANFPPIVQTNLFTDDMGNSYFASTGWKTVVGDLNIPTAGDYWVAFYFKENGGINTNTNPGPCIDNIQLIDKRAAGHCAADPTNLNITKANGRLNISWSGNATSYDLLYYNVTNSTDTTHTLVPGLTTTSHTVALATIPEGCYSFRVRAICGTDTSLWVEKTNILVYDPAAHCLDYLNFSAPGVTCTTGSFDNPYANTGAVDNGPEAKSSRHTVHYIPGETDPRTGGGLRTVKDGVIGTVRLGNWNTGAEAESVSYTYTLPRNSNVVMLLHYAVVLEDPGHDESQQPRFRLEILNSNGVVLDATCNVVDFKAKADPAWHNYGSGYNQIRWKDWTTMGINLQQYAGQTIKVRVTTFDCDQSGHYGYAYFALDCSDGNIQGMSCGEVPEKFTVSEGFNYRWYKMLDGAAVPEAQLSEGGRVFTPLAGDTCSYYVDLISPENANCYFTLNAYNTPRVPRSIATFTWSPTDCQNKVTVDNQSGVYCIPSRFPEYLAKDTIQSYYWDLGEYGTSTLKTPDIVVPNEGDTFDITLRVGFNGCFDTDTFTVYAPAIGPTRGETDAFICAGTGTMFNGKLYKEAGDYIDTLKSFSGCDSILALHLEVLVTDTIESDSLICSDETIDFYGQKLNKTGHYEHHVPSSIGCDTLLYTLDLTVLDVLDLALTAQPAPVCADDEQLTFSVDVRSGMVTDYQIIYSEAARAGGFADTEVLMADTATGIFTIDIPDGIRPDIYDATAVFFNSDCGNVELPLTLDIRYPASVITQRWNDVLSVTNFDYNGGYNFSAFQWHLDGAPIAGETASQIYHENRNLEFGREYSVLLTRTDDGRSQLSCAMVPTEYDLQQMTEVSTVVFPGSSVAIDVPQSAVARVYTLSGTLVSTQHITTGSNTITMPATQGIYLLHITYPDTTPTTTKIVVQK